jgi:hypothetical protein
LGEEVEESAGARLFGRFQRLAMTALPGQQLDGQLEHRLVLIREAALHEVVRHQLAAQALEPGDLLARGGQRLLAPTEPLERLRAYVQRRQHSVDDAATARDLQRLVRGHQRVGEAADTPIGAAELPVPHRARLGVDAAGDHDFEQLDRARGLAHPDVRA